MAHPGLSKHRKFRLLVYLLREPEPHVRGYLEMLWEVGYETGNPLVGDAAAVEAAAKFPGHPGRLASALHHAGFLDQLANGEFLIHDLIENAPEWVKNKARSKKWRHATRVGGARNARCDALPSATERSEALREPPPHHTTKKKDPKKDLSAAASQPEKGTPNPIWDALCLAFGLKPVTKSECKRVGRIVADLKAKAARPEDIALRLERYRRAWPDVAATPEALLKHWDAFASGGPAQESAEERDARIQQERSEAQAQRASAARDVSLSELFKEEPDA